MTDWSSSLSVTRRVFSRLLSFKDMSLFLLTVTSKFWQSSWYSPWALSHSFSSLVVCSLISSFSWFRVSSFLLVEAMVCYLFFISSIKLAWSLSAWSNTLSNLVFEDSSCLVSFSSCFKVLIDSSNNLFNLSHSFSFLALSSFNCFNYKIRIKIYCYGEAFVLFLLKFIIFLNFSVWCHKWWNFNLSIFTHSFQCGIFSDCVINLNRYFMYLHF